MSAIQSALVTGASLVMIGGISMIGLGFWKVYPAWVLLGAGLILGGYAIGMVADFE